MLTRTARLWRMTAHLETGQLFHRLRLRARRALWERTAPRADRRYRERAAGVPAARMGDPGLRRVAALRAARRNPDAAMRVADDAVAGRFTFLHRTREFGEPLDWYRPDLDEGTRLWKTLLHEFPYALDLALARERTGETRYRERFLDLAASWIETSPVDRPDFALDCWNARAVATRLTHWAVAGCLLGLPDGDPRTRALERSLAVHALFLRDNLELDLRANHLMRDLCGLVWADRLMGCVPDALALLEAEHERQVLPDGCHEERTPLYHAIVLQDLHEVRVLLGPDAPHWLDAAVLRMAGFLRYLLPEDGALPLLGDTWHGEIDPVSLLAEIDGEPVEPVEPERHGGLVVLRRGPLHAVLRAGPHGPDHQLGHAHADGLSFEASWAGRRVVTDTGTGTYDPGPIRDRVRGTAAHNTVQLDGAEQLETWHSFRVGRRGRARCLARGRSEAAEWLWAGHDGWSWLPGSPAHQRLWLAADDGLLVVLDAVTGAGRHRVESRLHLHPEAAGAPAIPLGEADCRGRDASPLYEHWHQDRSMPELWVRREGDLPWLGGWLIDLSGSGLPEVAWTSEPDAIALSVAGPTGWRLRWSGFGNPTPEGVQLHSGPVQESPSHGRRPTGRKGGGNG